MSNSNSNSISYFNVRNYNNKLIMYVVLSFIIGLNITYILDSFEIINGQEGVDYYSEVHTSRFNSYMHTVFMPFTYGGFNLAIPAILGMSRSNSFIMQLSFYVIYITHYISFNYFIGIMFGLYYAMSFHFSCNIFNKFYKYRNYLILGGLSLSICALFIQEIIGHWIGGDDPSRPEGVLNAILYAMYYSVEHLFI